MLNYHQLPGKLKKKNWINETLTDSRAVPSNKACWSFLGVETYVEVPLAFWKLPEAVWHSRNHDPETWQAVPQAQQTFGFGFCIRALSYTYPARQVNTNKAWIACMCGRRRVGEGACLAPGLQALREIMKEGLREPPAKDCDEYKVRWPVTSTTKDLLRTRRR